MVEQSRIDPLGAARTLWTETHPLRSVAEPNEPGSGDSQQPPQIQGPTGNRKTKSIIAAGKGGPIFLACELRRNKGPAAIESSS